MAKSPHRTYLNVPYAEKDAAKKLGARWAPKYKKWYIPENVEATALLSKWEVVSQYQSRGRTFFRAQGAAHKKENPVKKVLRQLNGAAGNVTKKGHCFGSGCHKLLTTEDKDHSFCNSCWDKTFKRAPPTKKVNPKMTAEYNDWHTLDDHLDFGALLRGIHRIQERGGSAADEKTFLDGVCDRFGHQRFDLQEKTVTKPVEPEPPTPGPAPGPGPAPAPAPPPAAGEERCPGCSHLLLDWPADHELAGKFCGGNVCYREIPWSDDDVDDIPDECPGCETGCDADDPHRLPNGEFHPNCATREATVAQLEPCMWCGKGCEGGFCGRACYKADQRDQEARF